MFKLDSHKMLLRLPFIKLQKKNQLKQLPKIAIFERVLPTSLNSIR